VNVWRVARLVASNSLTVVLLKSVTQMFAPSKQMPLGPLGDSCSRRFVS
jgi:hypothetical protein